MILCRVQNAIRGERAQELLVGDKPVASLRLHIVGAALNVC